MSTSDLWALADYRGVAERLAPAARALVDATAPLSGRRVLDLAAGTGNVAVLAVEAGAEVTAVDSSPRMVQLGRERTGADVRWLEGDLEQVPLPDGSVDVVLTAFGLIFAARPEDAVAQVRRVLAPGGTLALTAWTVDGFMGRMTRTIAGFLPPNPDAPDAIGWGEQDTARARLASAFDDITVRGGSVPWRFGSAAAMTAFLRTHSPPHVAAAHAAGDRADEMFDAIEALAAPGGGPVRLDAEYLLVRGLVRAGA